MNDRRPALRLRAERGLSLPELMVAMGIGLLLLGALAFFFVGSRQVNTSTDDVSRVQESGRNALELMGRAIRQAGYRSDPNFAFAGTALAGTDGASSAPDSITVQYAAQQGGEWDCTRTNNIAAGSVVTAAFAIATDTSVTPNVPVLTCNGTVVVDNIEDMQIAYGIDAAKDGNVEFYTTTPTPAQFGQVAAVRISVLARGPTASAAATKTQTYTYNGAAATKTDGYVRRVFTATFAVRNQAW
jgi:type IV pilus assembly protein PilW